MRYLDMTPRYGLLAAGTCGIVTIMAVIAASLNHFAVHIIVDKMLTRPPLLLEVFSVGRITLLWAAALTVLGVCYAKDEKANGVIVAVVVTIGVGFVFAMLAGAAFVTIFGQCRMTLTG